MMKNKVKILVESLLLKEESKFEFELPKYNASKQDLSSSIYEMTKSDYENFIKDQIKYYENFIIKNKQELNYNKDSAIGVRLKKEINAFKKMIPLFKKALEKINKMKNI